MCQINGTFGINVAATVPCHLYAPGAAIPEGYGVPWDVFNPTELELKAFCTNASVTAEVGPGSSTRIVHTQGYQLNTATKQWEPFTYTCDAPLISGVWCPGNAAADLNPTHPSFIANTCSLVNNAWRCGCRDQACTQDFWQLQVFQAPPSSTTTLVGTWTGTWQSLSPIMAGGTLTLIITSENQWAPGTFRWTGTLTKTGPGRSNTANMPVTGNADLCLGQSICLGNSFSFSGTPPGESAGCQANFVAAEGMAGARVSPTRIEGGLYDILPYCQSLDLEGGNFMLQKQ
jgi:hypothetical protein